MIKQHPSVIRLKKEQRRQMPPTVTADIGCFPTWDMRAAKWLARLAASIIRAMHNMLQIAAVIVTWNMASYVKVRSFASAHRRGLVRKKILAKRLKVCNASCPWHERRSDGRDYCRGVKCNCGNWSASSLAWRLRLKTFACPLRKFGSE